MNTKEADPFAEPSMGKKAAALDSLTFNNNNTMCCYKKNLILLQEGGATFNVMRVRLYSWHEFLKKLREQDREDWVTVLTAALQIYVFEMKGLASVPDEKE